MCTDYLRRVIDLIGETNSSFTHNYGGISTSDTM